MGLIKDKVKSQYESNQYTPGHRYTAFLLKINYSITERGPRHIETKGDGDSPIPANFETHTLIPIYEVLSWLTFQKVGRGNISSASAVNYSWMAPPPSSSSLAFASLYVRMPPRDSVMVSAWKRLGSAEMRLECSWLRDYAALVKFRFMYRITYDSDCAEVADR